MKKTLLIMTVSLLFVQPNLAQIFPQDHTHFFFFFFGFQLNILGYSININNFDWNPVFLKKNC